MEQNYLLTYLILIPIVGAISILFFKKDNEKVIRYAAITISSIAFIATFIIALVIHYKFDFLNPEFQFIHRVRWVDRLHIDYHVGIDGMSLLLVTLTTFITPLTFLGSWSGIKKRVKEFTFFFLLLEAGMIGVFISLDLFLFYIFWEAALIPMYFVIGIWGAENRIYAAVKFFIFTMAGSLLMLVAIIWLAVYASGPLGYFTTNLRELYTVAPHIPLHIQIFLFIAFAISFGIKIPLFPLHTWLPDAHVQAPTISVILAGILLKMGTYGLLRFNIPLFPKVAVMAAPYMSALAIIGIIYGALVSMVQTDMKKLIAYSSVSHMGFIVLGIFAFTQLSVQGAIIQMINHGLSTGALFFLVMMIYDRTHTRNIADYGGLAKVLPIFSVALMFTTLSSIGLPGLNGFVGEFLILVGTFKSSVLGSWWYAILATSGVVLSAVYLLWMYQRVIFGNVTNNSLLKLKDLNKREIFILIPIFIIIIWIGVYPSTFLNISNKSAEKIVKQIQNIDKLTPIDHELNKKSGRNN